MLMINNKGNREEKERERERAWESNNILLQYCNKWKIKLLSRCSSCSSCKMLLLVPRFTEWTPVSDERKRYMGDRR